MVISLLQETSLFTCMIGLKSEFPCMGKHSSTSTFYLYMPPLKEVFSKNTHGINAIFGRTTTVSRHLPNRNETNIREFIIGRSLKKKLPMW